LTTANDGNRDFGIGKPNSDIYGVIYMEEKIPPTKIALTEALALSAEILQNIELSQFPLENIALKTGRLARLLNDFQMQKIIEYEVAGYPTFPEGLPPNIYQLVLVLSINISKNIEHKLPSFISLYN
jgi:hypothetical protein